MKNLSLQRFWEENKKSLLVSGSGLVLFLFSYSLIVTESKTAAEATRRQIHEDLEPIVWRLYKTVRDRYDEEAKRLEAYERFEENLLKKATIVPPKNLSQSIREAGGAEPFFSEKIDEIWATLKKRRAELSLDSELPLKISARELDVRPEDTESDFRRHYLHLEVLRRSLEALLESGMRRIEKPRIRQDEALPIRGNNEQEIVYRRVTVQAHGPYQSFCDLVRRMQKPGDARGPAGLVQVLLNDLDSKKSLGQGLLRGTLVFSTFSVEEVAEEPAAYPRDSSSRLPRRRR